MQYVSDAAWDLKRTETFPSAASSNPVESVNLTKSPVKLMHFPPFDPKSAKFTLFPDVDEYDWPESVTDSKPVMFDPLVVSSVVSEKSKNETIEERAAIFVAVSRSEEPPFPPPPTRTLVPLRSVK